MPKMNKKIAIIGLGYVGLTLSLVFSKKGFRVYGIENNKKINEMLTRGVPHFYEEGLKDILIEQLSNSNFSIHDNLENLSADIYIVTVGTPLDVNLSPNINHINSAVNTIAPNLKKEDLVILRSTVSVGTTRNVVIPILEDVSNLAAGEDFSVSFAPERTLEGLALIELETNPQIIGGINDKSVSQTSDLFKNLTLDIVKVSSIESAEMIKIIDNSYRDSLFSFSNEIALLSEKLKLDASELIDAANYNYPRNSIPKPSPGVGGACLSKDPYILIDLAEKNSYSADLIKAARKTNESVTNEMVQRIKVSLNDMGKKISESKILVVGFAFKGKPETSDLRGSTTLLFLESLRKEASYIFGFDPVISNSDLEYLGIKLVDSIYDGQDKYDVIVLFNNHVSYKNLVIDDLISKLKKPAIIYDCWRSLDKKAFDNYDDIEYMGVGV